MKQSKHNKILEQIINNPSRINEDKKSMSFLIREPIWLKKNSTEYQKMCDLILGYGHYGVPIEIKGSNNHRDKAIDQIFQGMKFAKIELGIYCPYGKIIYYSQDSKNSINNLKYEIVQNQ